MTNVYKTRTRVYFGGQFSDPETGDPANPATVTVTVTAPDGTVSTPTAASTETGVWMASVVADQVGVWRYVFQGSDDLLVAAEGYFRVM